MITVVCLNFNGNDSLRESIQSVLDQTQKPDRFVVIDNASTDGSRQIAVDMGVEVVDADNRHKFITGLNKAIELNQDLLFFIQNDVTLEPNCLKVMLNSSPSKNFIAQPLIYQMDGKIDNAGMDIWWPGFAFRRRKVYWGYKSYYCGLVTTICFLTDNKTFFYDKDFSPAYMEDVDFYLRTNGIFDHIIIPNATAIHKGNHTFSETYKKLEISRICRKNRTKLLKKHYSFAMLAVASCLHIVKEAIDVITNRWVTPNNRH